VISVIVPVRNGMPWLEEQLDALIRQRCTADWEVIVADNGSTDESPVVARRWADRHGAVRWLDASATPGPGAARNAGAREAIGDQLAFCDADDVVRPDWLTGCVTGLDAADVVAGLFDFHSLNGHRASPPRPASVRQLGFLPAGLGANLAVRRHAFEEVGGFAEELMIGEDIDLCWRLQLRGFRFAIANGAVVSKRDHPGFKTTFRHGTAYGRSGVTLYRRHRASGARPDLRGAAKSWLWLIMTSPRLVKASRLRNEWAHAAGMRSGRLRESAEERVFFP
jgi:GT2 family glycosyltransferase